MSLTLRSPAKLNLYLKVQSKRPDGYHNLKTIFERIDLYDDITFKSNNLGKIRIKCNHPHVPVGRKNLVYKICELIKNKYKIDKGVDIRINKRIPVAAGLAGGSSNAATTILGLNKIWKLRLSKPQMVALGAAVGSDVPFFLHDASFALGTDRGDRIKKLKIRSKLWHILVVPRVKMYSSEVFTALKLQLTKKSDNASILIRSLKRCDLLEISDLLSNDLESSILRIRPRLLNVKKRLKNFGLKGVVFSGSGPSVFGLADSKKEAEKIKKILRKRYAQVFAVRTY